MPYLHKFVDVIFDWGEGFIVPIKKVDIENLKNIGALRYLVLLVNCLLPVLKVGWMIGMKNIMFILKHRQVLEKVWYGDDQWYFYFAWLNFSLN